jgi:hypothetical protein
MATVTWSDYWVVLEGVVKEGVLEVKDAPRLVESTLGEAHLRFSPVTEPLKSGTTVWWAVDVENTGSEPLVLTFTSGQRADVVLSRDGVEVYRWSEGRIFTEAIETLTLGPGEVLPIVMNDHLPPLQSGDYDLVATITAAVGPHGTGPQLPALAMTVGVF